MRVAMGADFAGCKGEKMSSGDWGGKVSKGLEHPFRAVPGMGDKGEEELPDFGGIEGFRGVAEEISVVVAGFADQVSEVFPHVGMGEDCKEYDGQELPGGVVGV